ncbi:hypothetical protein ABIB49_002276 [Arthrobacter sp. UYCu512]
MAARNSSTDAPVAVVMFAGLFAAMRAVSQGPSAFVSYRIRIFSGSQEFPFAGHPTLGSAHAWLAAGGEPR